MHRIKWIFVIFIYCYPSFGIALPLNNSTNCYFLGSTPSLLIKFKNYPSTVYTSKTKIIATLKSTRVSFTLVRPMSGDAFIVFFTPKNLALAQTKPGCYSQQFIQNLIHELKTTNNIEHAEPNLLMKLSAAETSSLPPIIGPKQWNLLNPPGGIDAQHAFNLTLGSNRAIIAILDTGILPNNSLTPNLLPGVTFNHNGAFEVGAAPSCDASCDGYDHGTHVSGIAAASGDMAYGESIFGVAPHSKLLPINVFTKMTKSIDCRPDKPPCIRYFVADLINGLNWLHGETFTGLPVAPYVTVVNMSLGTNNSACSIFLQQAINLLIDKNISTAVAAGNDNIDASIVSPGNCNGVMTVAATDQFGFGTYYSNYGNVIAFAAPGGGSPIGAMIYSTVENGYNYEQGTSMASPHVAGLGALLYSLDPTLTPLMLLNVLKNTATPFPLGGPALSCIPTKPCGSGIINALLAAVFTKNHAARLVWHANLRININSRTQATLQWQPASWRPARDTKIIYTVNLNGVNVPGCINVLKTNCMITNANPKIVNKVFITATDIRQIYPPVVTSTQSFITFIFKGPILTVAERNPLNKSQAFIFYSSLGNAEADAFFIIGIPNATIALDTTKNRFVVNNITIPKSIANVRITAKYGDFVASSNPIIVPGIL